MQIYCFEMLVSRVPGGLGCRGFSPPTADGHAACLLHGVCSVSCMLYLLRKGCTFVAFVDICCFKHAAWGSAVKTLLLDLYNVLPSSETRGCPSEVGFMQGHQTVVNPTVLLKSCSSLNLQRKDRF